MKLHPPVYKAILDSLDEIFNNNRYADKAIEYHLKNQKKWGSRDRRYFAEAVYDIVRWWRKLWWRVGVEDIPGEVSQDQFENLVIAWLEYKDYPCPSWLEGRSINFHQEDSKNWAINESIPDWLKALGEEELGVEWQGLVHAMNQKAPIFLRTNFLKTSREDLLAKLREEEIDVVPVDSRAETLKLERRQNVFKTEAFKNGLFEVQDGGSQHIAPFLEVEPGQRVVDACAGAGGKSLHLASLMKNKGKLVALDIHKWKLDELKKRARRNSVDIIETRHIDSTKVIKRLKDSADRLLLDVPCTGLGVLRRNPDSKWKLSPEEHRKALAIQKDILNNYSFIVKAGGKVLYATCSLLKSENEIQVREFLKEHKGQWELEEEKRISPLHTEFDGFYMARLLRKGV